MGKLPKQIIVCVDRMESSERSSLSAKQIIERCYGVKIHPIINTHDIVKAIESGVISAKDYYEKIIDYFNCYRGE